MKKIFFILGFLGLLIFCWPGLSDGRYSSTLQSISTFFVRNSMKCWFRPEIPSFQVHCLCQLKSHCLPWNYSCLSFHASSSMVQLPRCKYFDPVSNFNRFLLGLMMDRLYAIKRPMAYSMVMKKDRLLRSLDIYSLKKSKEIPFSPLIIIKVNPVVLGHGDHSNSAPLVWPNYCPRLGK